MAQPRIQSIHIEGFRSLADVGLDDLPNVSVLIGANGSGKSNLFHFFKMLSWMLRGSGLSDFVARQGGAEDQLHGGSQKTNQIAAALRLRTDQGANDYAFNLAHAHPDRFIFTDERLRFSRAGSGSEAHWRHLGSGHDEPELRLAAEEGDDATARTIRFLLRECDVFQFHDTSDNSPFKRKWDLTHGWRLRSHGGNLAAVLFQLAEQEPRWYEEICRVVRVALPDFDGFVLDDEYGRVFLKWRSRHFDDPIGAHLTSDGSLRFMALATLLNLPPARQPSVLLIDEPELGLHPAAIVHAAEMIQAVGKDRQVLVATQSPLLVDSFDLDDIFVAERADGQTTFQRLNPSEYRVWLDDQYTAGDLWLKNVFGGRP